MLRYAHVRWHARRILVCLISCYYFPRAACVKDLIRALKGDDDTCEIRRDLGKAGILQKVRGVRINALEIKKKRSAHHCVIFGPHRIFSVSWSTSRTTPYSEIT